MSAKVISLPAPRNLEAGLTAVLKSRRSHRAYSDAPVTDAELSDILWSTAGISGPDGLRTAPSTMGLNAVTVLALRADGCWRYAADKNALELVCADDLRALTTLGQHEFVDNAPVTLVFTIERTERTKNVSALSAGIDAGTMMQSAHLACEALGLGGIIRISFDGRALAERMGLPETLEPIGCFTLGRPAA